MGSFFSRLQILGLVFIGLVFCNMPIIADESSHACRIEVFDDENGWPIPLVELRTTNDVRFITDNAGVIAMDDPSLMGHSVWFHVAGHGYGVPADGFGYRGVRLTLRPGKTIQVKLKRYSIAKRIGRLTGTGLFAESQKLGDRTEWKDDVVAGCDSVQNAVHRGKMYWAWGDTLFSSYPLGVFHMTSATTNLQPFASLAPPLKPKFNYFRDGQGRPAAVAKMPGKGPTWLTGYVSLPDKTGDEKLVAFYRKIQPPLEIYESGFCVWNDATQRFQHLRTVWNKKTGTPEPTLNGEGHACFWNDELGKRWLLLGNPLPKIRLPATFEAWQDGTQWDELEPQKTIPSWKGNADIEPHSGSIAWNEFRQKWVTVFMQKFGKPSAFGTIWYAESASPFGPWGPAIEVLSHDNYTFYNPRLHPEFTPSGSPILLFEGTYSAEFANHPQRTPRYNYNQILYRIDLDDPVLQRSLTAK